MELSRDEKRKLVMARLRMGDKPKDIAEDLGMTLPTVYNIRKQLASEQEDETIADLHSIPSDVITHVVEEAKEKLPTFEAALDSIKVGADGLKKLDAKFQETAVLALRRYDEVLRDPDTELKDINIIMSNVSTAYEKIFNSATNIHIGDKNTVSNQQLTIFKSKQGV